MKAQRARSIADARPNTTIERGERTMMLRLVLVGLVAALGVSLPSRRDGESWLESARIWASAQLADWDTWRPQGSDSCRLADAPIPVPLGMAPITPRVVVPEEGRLGEVPPNPPRRSSRGLGLGASAREEAPRIDPAPSGDPVPFEPIAGDDEPDRGIAFVPDCATDGLQLGSAAPSGEAPTELATADSGDSVECKVVVQVYRAIEAAGLAGTLGAAPIPRSGVIEADATLFEEDPGGYEPSPEELASDGRPEAPRGGPRQPFVPIDLPTHPFAGAAEGPNPLAEGIAIRREDAATPVARTPRFEPIDPPANPEAGIAEDLNRASDGLGPVPPGFARLAGSPARGAESVPSTRPRSQLAGDRNLPTIADPEARGPAANPGLAQAIHLTCDAAAAWMNVLAGSAPVAMTSQ
jgi:hypothetical protein